MNGVELRNGDRINGDRINMVRRGLEMIRQWSIKRALVILSLLGVLSLGLVGCGDRPRSSDRTHTSQPSKTAITRQLSEVSPPQLIQELRSQLDSDQPQVKILRPRADEVVNDTTVQVQVQVKDLPLFKQHDLELGPHLTAILDNQAYYEIYDASQPLVLENLEPGTHAIRVFASRPWHESFKNAGAYAQTTFSVLTKTPENNPSGDRPLLTYSWPRGSIGAEPVLLDFYLTNAPLHLVAQEQSDDDILDWKIRCTINGQSFTFDRWQPIYLKGFKPGKNWVQLELLDEKGNLILNPYNNTVRLITYAPGGQDTLSQLVRTDLSIQEARSIVDPDYVPEPEPEPEPAAPDLTAPEPIEPQPPKPQLTEPEPQSELESGRSLQPIPEPLLESEDSEPVVEDSDTPSSEGSSRPSQSQAGRSDAEAIPDSATLPDNSADQSPNELPDKLPAEAESSWTRFNQRRPDLQTLTESSETAEDLSSESQVERSQTDQTDQSPDGDSDTFELFESDTEPGMIPEIMPEMESPADAPSTQPDASGLRQRASQLRQQMMDRIQQRLKKTQTSASQSPEASAPTPSTPNENQPDTDEANALKTSSGSMAPDSMSHTPEIVVDPLLASSMEN